MQTKFTQEKCAAGHAPSAVQYKQTIAYSY